MKQPTRLAICWAYCLVFSCFNPSRLMPCFAHLRCFFQFQMSSMIAWSIKKPLPAKLLVARPWHGRITAKPFGCRKASGKFEAIRLQLSVYFRYSKVKVTAVYLVIWTPFFRVPWKEFSKKTLTIPECSGRFQLVNPTIYLNISRSK